MFRKAIALALIVFLAGTGETFALKPGDSFEYREWSSGNSSSHLSSWQDVRCHEVGKRYFVTRIQVWRERKGNADNFSAKMVVDCTKYENLGSTQVMIPSGSSVRRTVFEGSHRDETYWASISIEISSRFLTQFVFSTNPGEDYVKHIRARYNNADSDGLTGNTFAPWASLEGDTQKSLTSVADEITLGCPWDHAIEGISVRYTQNNSKIRRIRIWCRDLIPSGGVD